MDGTIFWANPSLFLAPLSLLYAGSWLFAELLATEKGNFCKKEKKTNFP
jgi:hypothetical protein